MNTGALAISELGCLIMQNTFYILKMLRTNIVLLHSSEKSELNKLAEASSRLWNKANYQRHALFHK